MQKCTIYHLCLSLQILVSKGTCLYVQETHECQARLRIPNEGDKMKIFTIALSDLENVIHSQGNLARLQKFVLHHRRLPAHTL